MEEDERDPCYVFGSNLYHQSCPKSYKPHDHQDQDQRRHMFRSDKVLREPTLLDLKIPGRSLEVLKATDSQTLVGIHRSKSFQNSETIDSQSFEGDEQVLELWGYKDKTQEDSAEAGSDFVKNLSDSNINRKKVKRWLGRESLVGYLTEDGQLYRLKAIPDERNLQPDLENSALHRSFSRLMIGSRNYQDLTISDTGQVLAALKVENNSDHSRGTKRTPCGENFSHESPPWLELWPSFESMAERFSSSSEIDEEPSTYRSIKLPNHNPRESVIELASGAAHFLILTSTSTTSPGQTYHSSLYSFGDNRFGQLGLGFRSRRVESPELIQELENIKAVDCGLFHSVVLGFEGEIHSFGHNRNGQCGIDEEEEEGLDLSKPCLVDIGGRGESGHPIDIINFSCGSEHTVALSSDGVWVTGSNSLGQLGLNREIKSSKQFELNRKIDLSSSTRKTLNENQIKYSLKNKDKFGSFWKVTCGRWNTFVWRKTNFE